MRLHRKNESKFEFHVNVIFVLILNEDLKAGFENRSTTKCANSIHVLTLANSIKFQVLLFFLIGIKFQVLCVKQL